MSNAIKDLLFDAGGNLSRPANFSIEITFPSNLNNQKNPIQYDILCKNISIPEITTKNVELTYKGSTIPILTRVDYNRTLSVTLLVDENHKILRDIITWQKGLDKNTLKPNLDIETMFSDSKNELLGSLNLVAKDWKDNEIARYSFSEIYPSKLGSIEYNSSSVSGFLELQVDFSFLVMNKEEGFEAMNVGLAQKVLDTTLTYLDNKALSLANSLFKESSFLDDSLSNVNKAKETILNNYESFLNPKGI